MADSGHPVTLLVYDLSQGMARALSMGLAGRQIDGIWHTSVVVFGTEHCFGQGVETFVPGTAPHGTPVERIDMGITHIPKDIFDEFLAHMRTIWTADKYHLLDNNCNSFSEELCQFLVGKSIPSHITGLPAEFLSTYVETAGRPFGQSILPMIENMFGPSRQARSVPAPAAPQGSPPSAQQQQIIQQLASIMQNNGTPAARAAQHPAAHVRPCTSLAEFSSLLASHRCVAVDFTASNCGPCRVISPEFDRLITEANESFRPLGVSGLPAMPILGLSVEVGNARELAAKYQITATPTFIFFLDGKKFHEFRGADRAELKSSIDLLLFTAFPAHSHAKLDLPFIVRMRDGGPVHFQLSSNLDAIFGKLKQYADQSGVPWNNAVAQALATWMKMPKGQRPSLASVTGWDAFLSSLLIKLPVNKVFPALDILRLLLLDDPVASAFFLVTDSANSLLHLMSKVATPASGEPIDKPTRLMMLRVGCNLFKAADPSVPLAQMSQPNGVADARALFTTLMVEHLLSPDKQLRQAAVLVAYNAAWSTTQCRPAKAPGSISTLGTSAPADEAWLCEMVAAVCDAIRAESESSDAASAGDDDVALRLVGALALLIVFSPDSIVELAQVVGVADCIKTISAARAEGIKALRAAAKAGDEAAEATRKAAIDKKDCVVKASADVLKILGA
ncbi:hypothetical protein HK105_201612 [Polyrhizophydium stewartii]|uniref:Uncharacterized protein n=1 Tax=Polyrhizophydium stewartii TaxID=2732419 RepID=A0ABR4NGW5_9FUNG